MTQGTGRYRMAHDLCRIDAIVTMPTVPVPKPYNAMTALGLQQKWFTCVDLVSAFFCLPRDTELRDVFLFIYNREPPLMRRQFGGKGGAVKVEAIWRGPDSRPALQPGLIGAGPNTLKRCSTRRICAICFY